MAAKGGEIVLTRNRYVELKRYLDGPIPVGGCPYEEYFLEQGYIESEDLTCRATPGVVIIGEALSYKLTGKGGAALDDYKRHMKGICFQLFLVLLGALLAFASDWVKSIAFG